MHAIKGEAKMIRIAMIVIAMIAFTGNASGQILINEFLASNVSINPVWWTHTRDREQYRTDTEYRESRSC